MTFTATGGMGVTSDESRRKSRGWGQHATFGHIVGDAEEGLAEMDFFVA